MKKVIEVTTPTCTICKMLKPMIMKVMESYKDKVELQEVSYEEELGKELIEMYGLKSVPAFFFINSEEVVDTHYGAIAVPQFKQKIESLLNA